MYHAAMVIDMDVERQMLKWKMDTDKFMTGVFSSELFCCSGAPEPSLVSDDGYSDVEYSEISSQASTRSP